MQQAVRPARVVAFDDAADGRWRVRADARALEGHAVDRVDMSARPRERHGAVRRGPVEIHSRRRTTLAHGRLVESAAEQPRARWQPLGEPADVVHQLFHALDFAQVEHRRQQVTDLPDVRVGVVESGYQRPAR